MNEIFAHAKVVPAGAGQSTLTKAPAEQRLLVLDAEGMLMAGEMVAKTVSAKVLPPGPVVTAHRAVRGRYLELKVAGGTVQDGAAQADHTIAVQFQTTKGQMLQGFVGLSVVSGHPARAPRRYPLAR